MAIEQSEIMKDNSAIISIDIGGTSIRGAMIPYPYLQPTQIDQLLPTDHYRGAMGVITQLKHIIGELIRENQSLNIMGISISTPGLVDAKQGIVRIALNLPQWTNIELVKQIENHFSLPVIIDNDANIGTLAEWYYTYNLKVESLIFVTVSTGIGSGLVQDGKLLRGVSGAAGELGHMSIDYKGPMCHECGKSRGCLTTLASGTAILNYVKSKDSKLHASLIWKLCGQKDEHINSKNIEEAARAGDKLASEAYNRAGEALGQALVNTIHLLDPQVIIMGGGVMSAGNLILKPMRDIILERLLDPTRISIIREASFGYYQGIAGATVNGMLHWETTPLRESV